MAKLIVQNESHLVDGEELAWRYFVDGQELIPGMTILRYDEAVGAWFEGEVGISWGYDHNRQRIAGLSFRVEGFVPSPLGAGQLVEIVSESDVTAS